MGVFAYSLVKFVMTKETPEERLLRWAAAKAKAEKIIRDGLVEDRLRRAADKKIITKSC